MRSSQLRLVYLVIACSVYAHAGPPFFTDDPEPVPFRHYEFYVFSTLDRTHGSHGIALPAFEFNLGPAPNLQLHIVVPMALLIPDQQPSRYGIGDVELGAKYRFLQEKSWRPQVGTFPMIELPTGSGQLGLGNGELWAKLPLWIQKSWGPWTSYGGGGYIINRASGMRDHAFFGWQVQREIKHKLTLGAEWFNPGRSSVAAGNTHLVNAGGVYAFTENLSLLLTAGHSVHGDPHTVAYVGLYWTWGPRTGGSVKPSGPTDAWFAGSSRRLHY